MDKHWERVQTPEHRGRISAETAWKGIFTCLANSRRLFLDAVALAKDGRYASSATLATIAAEESCKWVYLLSLMAAIDDKAVVKSWRAFSDHREKLRMSWQLLRNLFARITENDQVLADVLPHLPSMTAKLREQATYTVLLKGEEWLVPEAVVDEAGAKNWLGTVHALLISTHLQGFGAVGLLRMLEVEASRRGVAGPREMLEFALSEAGQATLRQNVLDFERWGALATEQFIQGVLGGKAVSEEVEIGQ